MAACVDRGRQFQLRCGWRKLGPYSSGGADRLGRLKGQRDVRKLLIVGGSYSSRSAQENASPIFEFCNGLESSGEHQHRLSPVLGRCKAVRRSVATAIVKNCVQEDRNCRLYQIASHERKQPSTHQFLSVTDKISQPKEPGAVQSYRSKEYSDRSS
jgi:hypothetical protein